MGRPVGPSVPPEGPRRLSVTPKVSPGSETQELEGPGGVPEVMGSSTGSRREGLEGRGEGLGSGSGVFIEEDEVSRGKR